MTNFVADCLILFRSARNSVVMSVTPILKTECVLKAMKSLILKSYCSYRSIEYWTELQKMLIIIFEVYICNFSITFTFACLHTEIM